MNLAFGSQFGFGTNQRGEPLRAISPIFEPVVIRGVGEVRPEHKAKKETIIKQSLSTHSEPRINATPKHEPRRESSRPYKSAIRSPKPNSQKRPRNATKETPSTRPPWNDRVEKDILFDPSLSKRALQGERSNRNQKRIEESKSVAEKRKTGTKAQRKATKPNRKIKKKTGPKVVYRLDGRVHRISSTVHRPHHSHRVLQPPFRDQVATKEKSSLLPHMSENYQYRNNTPKRVELGVGHRTETSADGDLSEDILIRWLRRHLRNHHQVLEHIFRSMDRADRDDGTVSLQSFLEALGSQEIHLPDNKVSALHAFEQQAPSGHTLRICYQVLVSQRIRSQTLKLLRWARVSNDTCQVPQVETAGQLETPIPRRNPAPAAQSISRQFSWPKVNLTFSNRSSGVEAPVTSESHAEVTRIEYPQRVWGKGPGNSPLHSAGPTSTRRQVVVETHSKPKMSPVVHVPKPSVIMGDSDCEYVSNKPHSGGNQQATATVQIKDTRKKQSQECSKVGSFRRVVNGIEQVVQEEDEVVLRNHGKGNPVRGMVIHHGARSSSIINEKRPTSKVVQRLPNSNQVECRNSGLGKHQNRFDRNALQVQLTKIENNLMKYDKMSCAISEKLQQTRTIEQSIKAKWSLCDSDDYIPALHSNHNHKPAETIISKNRNLHTPHQSVLQENQVDRIIKAKLLYFRFKERTEESLFGTGTSQWQVGEELADLILQDMLDQVAEEVGKATHEISSSIFETL